MPNGLIHVKPGPSLIPWPSLGLVFDRLQYAKNTTSDKKMEPGKEAKILWFYLG